MTDLVASLDSSSGMVHSTMKSTSTWVLMEGRGQKMRSNFISSSAPFGYPTSDVQLMQDSPKGLISHNYNRVGLKIGSELPS